jgi:putative transposase
MKKKRKSLPTIWEVPDELWKRMAPLILEMDSQKETGRPRANPRNVVDALNFRIRTGCQWNHIPRVYGDDATIHRTFQHWVEIGLFPRLWALLVEECDEFGLVDWEWQAADGTMGKARLGGDEVGPNPTDRAKRGSKKRFFQAIERYVTNRGNYKSGQSSPLTSILKMVIYQWFR